MDYKEFEEFSKGDVIEILRKEQRGMSSQLFYFIGAHPDYVLVSEKLWKRGTDVSDFDGQISLESSLESKIFYNQVVEITQHANSESVLGRLED